MDDVILIEVVDIGGWEVIHGRCKARQGPPGQVHG
jgi:hypothetical protein